VGFLKGRRPRLRVGKVESEMHGLGILAHAYPGKICRSSFAKSVSTIPSIREHGDLRMSPFADNLSTKRSSIRI